jgi:phage-related minor tail protein
MSVTRTISTKLAIEGEAEYQAKVRECNAALKETGSALDLVNAKYDANDKSMEAVKARGEALEAMYDAQNKKLTESRAALENARQAQEKHGKTVDDLKKRLADATDELNKMTESGEDNEEQQKALKDEIDKLNKELGIAQNMYDAASKGVTNWTISANKAEADLYKLQRRIEENNKTMEDTPGTAKEAGDSLGYLGKMGEDAKSMIGDFLGKAAEMATLAGIIGITKQLGQALYDMADAYMEAAATIEKATGATKDGLNDMTNTAYEALAQTYTTLDNISGAVGEINTRFGVTGDDLERLTVMFAEFARITGKDVVGAVQQVSKIEKAWNIDMADTELLMDKLAKGAQASGISVDSLSSMLIENKAQFTSLGYGLDEAIGLLSMMELEGVNASQALAGLRAAANKLARAGKDSKDGIQEYIQAIKEAKTQTEAAKIGLEAFGEDAGGTLVEAIRSGRFELGEWTEMIATADGTLQATADTSKTFGEIWQNVKNQVTASIQEIGQQIDQMTGKTADALTQSDAMLADAQSNYEASSNRIAAASTVAAEYVARLDALEKQGVTTSEAQQEYNNLIEQLNTIMPELNLQLDEQTGLLKGGAEALLDNVEAWKQWATQQAMQDKYTDTLKAYGQAQVEVAENTVKRAEAQEKVNKAQAEYNAAYLLWQKALSEEDYDADIPSLEDAWKDAGATLRKAQTELENYDKALDDANETMEDCNEQIEAMGKVLDETTDTTVEDTEDMADSWEQYAESAGAAVEAINAELAALQEEYKAAYDTARTAIDGQISAFKEMHQATAQEAQAAAEALGKALESQIQYLAEYNANFEDLMSRNIDGIDKLASALADGSEESAAILAGLSDMTDEEIEDIIDKMGDVEKGKDVFAENVAKMQTDYDERMEGIRTKTQEVMEDVVQKLNESERAYASAASTGAAVAEGLQSQVGAIQAVADEINSILQSIGNMADQVSAKAGKIKKPGQSKNGTSAAVGLYSVPYDEFEAVLHQGERVLTAAEARVYNAAEKSGKLTNNNDNSKTVNVGGITINDGGNGRKVARQVEKAIRRALR